jgi:exopolysaccharide biosynthesis polyprenyl glycosylphosphotransferase
MATLARSVSSTISPEVILFPPSLSPWEHGPAIEFSVAGVRRSLFVLADLCGIWSLALIVLAFRFPTSQIQVGAKAFTAHVGFVLLYSVLIVLFCHTQRLYTLYQSASSHTEALAICKSIALATVLVTASIYASGSNEISRSVIVLTGVAAFLTMNTWRQFRRHSLRSATADGLNCHNVLIIGTDSVALGLRDYLVSQRQFGFVVLGLLAPTEDQGPKGENQGGEDVLGTVADLPRLCRTHFVDEIIICAPQRSVIKSVIAKAREYRVGVRVIPDLYDGMAWGARLDYLGNYPALAIVQRDVPAIQFKLKRILDVLISAAVLLLLSPVLLLLAIIVKLNSRGPVFYGSQRVGKKGKSFSCYKFRTMVTNADQLKAKLQHLNERDDILFKIANDPRITSSGRYMRKYSLDELAQLWNVLKGDMSLVGPRPPLASEVKQYELDYLLRLEAAPGITGLWQVQARNSPSFKDYISLDLRYVENWSFGLDIKILFRTIAVVLSGTGS